jgi:hypothetical protein
MATDSNSNSNTGDTLLKNIVDLSYDKGYNNGFDKGYNNGFDRGYSVGGYITGIVLMLIIINRRAIDRFGVWLVGSDD